MKPEKINSRSLAVGSSAPSWYRRVYQVWWLALQSGLGPLGRKRERGREGVNYEPGVHRLVATRVFVDPNGSFYCGLRTIESKFYTRRHWALPTIPKLIYLWNTILLLRTNRKFTTRLSLCFKLKK